jgi:hypothetical protein
MYKIAEETRRIAKAKGLRVEPSQVKHKKISVFRGDDYLGSVGALGYDDYHTFKRKQGQAVADEHRRRYLIRHEKDRHKKDSKGYLASVLLWNG